MDPVKFGVVGIGGFAKTHLRAVTELQREGQAHLNAVVVRNPEKYRSEVADLARRGVRILQSLEELLGAGGVDCVSLPTGIQHHVPQTLACLQRGYHVLCEKPVAALVQDADRMVTADRESTHMVVIGYQAVFTQAIQTIKARILDGRPGKVRSIHVKGGWPRDDG